MKSSAESKVEVPTGNTSGTSGNTVAQVPQYLSLKRLNMKEMPPHPEFTAQENENRMSLVQFLNNILTEVARVNFDDGYTSHGKWHPDGMSTYTKQVPVCGIH